MSRSPFNHGNEINSSSNRSTLWNAYLPNHFPNYKNYSIHEIDDALYELYDQSNHPAAKPIKELLMATSRFLRQNPVEKDLSRSSEECKTEEDMNKTFKDIGGALKEAQDQCKDELKNSTGQIVLEAAISYCKRSIDLRLQTLQESNKAFYDKHIGQANSLRKMI